jgi:hypothetical protein
MEHAIELGLELELEIRQTTSTVDESDNVCPLKKYAVIAGQRVALPVDARFYFQDKRGLWFWSKRKPRIKQDDWTTNKEPVQICTEQGHKRCLQTSPQHGRSRHWSQSLMQTVDLKNQPLFSAPELDELLAIGTK